MSTTTLWYATPANETWGAALPLGSGRLGAMVAGNPRNEVLWLNEDSLWYGGHHHRTNPDAPVVLPEIRRLLEVGKPREAEVLASDGLDGIPRVLGHYEPLGKLVIWNHLPGDDAGRIVTGLGYRYDQEAAVTGYRRDLDLSTAIATTRFTLNGVTLVREYLASHVDGVIAVRLTADRAGAISFRTRVERSVALCVQSDGVIPEGQDAVVLHGQAGGAGAVAFACALAVTVRGGRVSRTGQTVRVDGADEAVVWLSAGTTFREADPQRTTLARVRAAQALGWSPLVARHLAEYQPQFRRVSLDLGGPDCSHLPTDARLEAVRAGEADPGLIALHAQFGRYLLIASSRPGSLPANLQGIWNHEAFPSWGSKYTININLQMNYWPAEVAALPECHTALFDHLERMYVDGQRVARDMYGARGWVAHHNTDHWGNCAPVDGYIPATFQPMGAAWLMIHWWEACRFAPHDRELLMRGWPLLRDAARFLLDVMVEDAQGRLITSPTSSPENTYIMGDGRTGRLSAGCMIDAAITDQLFGACEEAHGRLGLTDGFAAEVAAARARLPVPTIGSDGRLLEWLEEYGEVEPGHRHISHLYALHPGEVIHPQDTPELAAAARATLDHRVAHGGGHTGWSRAWMINFWARLQDGAQAWENLRLLLVKSTLPNLFDDHPPFQIDGNFGASAGMFEMLVQSHRREPDGTTIIDLLPALPPAVPNGAVRGLRTRGGFVVESLVWKDSRVQEAVIAAPQGGSCVVRTGQVRTPLRLSPGGSHRLG